MQTGFPFPAEATAADLQGLTAAMFMRTAQRPAQWTELGQ